MVYIEVDHVLQRVQKCASSEFTLQLFQNKVRRKTETMYMHVNVSQLEAHLC